MTEQEKRPLLIIYEQDEQESITLELSQTITFMEKMALLSFLRMYCKDLEKDIMAEFKDIEEE